MNYKPLNSRVLVLPKDVQKKSPGGIIIPDTKLERPTEGEVIAIADDVEHCKVGETVVYGTNSGVEIMIEGTEYIIIQEKDILAIK